MAAITKYRTCNLCEAICGLEIQIDADTQEVLSIRGDKKDTFSKGHICPKAVALKDIHEDPDRLKKPVRKINGEWVEISWQEAFDYTAKQLYSIQQKYGDNSVGIYHGNPAVHNLGTTLFSKGLIRSLSTKNRFSATSVDQLGHHLAGEMMFGHMFLMPVPDIDRTDFWVIMGGNPMVSNGSLMTAPDVSGRMRAIRERGGKIVVIDPRRTETSDRADQHIFIKPGTDIYLLLGIINHVLQNDLVNLGHLEELIKPEQIEEIRAAVKRFDIAHTSELTGIPTDIITELAVAYSKSKNGAWYGRLGVSANMYGALAHWAINTLNILTGHLDKEGGSMFTTPAVDLAAKKGRSKKFGRWRSRVQNLPEMGGELPSAAMAEEILTPGEGQIKAFVTNCGNPVLSVPNGRRLDQAFESLEFMVSFDIYINETTRHADIILPPATGLETPHYPIAFHNLAIRNTANYSAPVLDKEEDALYDYQVLMGVQKAYEKLRLSEEEQEKNKAYFGMTPEIMLSFSLKSGSSGLSMKDLASNPHGIDLGPLKSQMKDRLLTDDKKIDLFPEIFSQQLSEIPLSPAKRDGYLLIGRRHLRSNNSWLHNAERMVKGRERCTLLVHPKDAADLGFETGAEVLVSSEVGEVRIKAEVSDEMMPGSVSIPHGWGHNRKGIKLSVAEKHSGVSLNDLIDNKLTDPLTGVSVINGVPVQISKVD